MTTRLRAPTDWHEDDANLPDFKSRYVNDLHIVGTDKADPASKIVGVVDDIYEDEEPIDIIVVDVGNLRRSAVSAKLATNADWLVLCVPERNQRRRDLEQTADTYGMTDNLLLALTGARAKRRIKQQPQPQTEPRALKPGPRKNRDTQEAA